MRRLFKAAPICLPLLAGVSAAAITWNRWITPFVDSSREMQVPARLAAGERLYRDVVYYYGPIGPWCGALVLKTFGRRWGWLEAMCAAVSLLLFVALYRLTKASGSRLSAVAATTGAAALCVGAPLGGAFLFPYSIDSLFALAFGLLALALFCGGPFRSRNAIAAAALGVCLGSRVEIGAAAVFLVLGGELRAEPSGSSQRPGLRIAAGGLALGAAFQAAALFGVPLRDLFPEGPAAVFSPPAEWRNVYRLVAGLDDPWESLSRIASSLFLLGGVLLGAWVFRRGRWSVLWAALVGSAALLVLSPLGGLVDSRWPPLLLAAPPAAVLLALWQLRRPLTPVARARFVLFGIAAVFGGRVLLRLSYAQLSTPYSILALPALLAASAVILVDVLPRRLGGESQFRVNVSVVFLGIALAGLARLQRISVPGRNWPVSTPAGSLRLPPLQALPTRAAFGFLEQARRPGDALAAFPEAGIFNFALGMPNPLREEQLLPGHLDFRAEARVVDRLLKTPPRFVLLANQPSSAFGPAAFGEDYDRSLWEAVLSNYSVVASFGTSDPRARVGSQLFFLRLYERISPVP